MGTTTDLSTHGSPPMDFSVRPGTVLPPLRRSPRTHLAALLLALIPFATGCGDDVPNLGGTVATTLEELPVPAVAVFASNQAGSAREPILIYRLDGVAYEDLKAWYRAELPLGEPWNQWLWCTSEEGDAGFTRHYHQPGEGVLSVVLTHDGTIILSFSLSGRC
jgi:hypothetical protein